MNRAWLTGPARNQRGVFNLLSTSNDKGSSITYRIQSSCALFGMNVLFDNPITSCLSELKVFCEHYH
jgi:hypothetical protein